MDEIRHVRLFRNGRNQAVRIPVEFELPGNEAVMRRDGSRLVIEPLAKRGLSALLATFESVDDAFPDIADVRLLTRYLLDTNIISDLVRNPRAALLRGSPNAAIAPF